MNNVEMMDNVAEVFRRVRREGFRAGYAAGIEAMRRELGAAFKVIRANTPEEDDLPIGPQAAQTVAVSSPEPEAVTAGGPAPDTETAPQAGGASPVANSEPAGAAAPPAPEIGPQSAPDAAGPKPPEAAPAAVEQSATEPEPEPEPKPVPIRDPRIPKGDSAGKLSRQMRELFDYLIRTADAGELLPYGRMKLADAAGIPRGSITLLCEELSRRRWAHIETTPGGRPTSVRFIDGSVLKAMGADEVKEKAGLFSTPVRRRCLSCHQMFETRNVVQETCPSCTAAGVAGRA